MRYLAVPFLFLPFGPALAQTDCSPCPSTHCYSQTLGQGCFPVGTCNVNPPFCDAGSPPPPPPSGAISSVMVSIAVSGSPTFTLTMMPNPAGPLSCSAAPGTIVSTASTTGGDGKTAALSITGDTASFTLNGHNLVVGPSGIAAADCGRTDAVTVTATQP